MNNRRYLRKSILLCGSSDGNVFKRTFNIVKVCNEGASAVCYAAYHDNSGMGILKEFYPIDAYALERNNDGQLVHSPKYGSAKERFHAMENEYLESYQLLLDAKKNGNNAVLSTFIPTFEIYHGCNDAGEIIGTTYIWMPDPELETFEKVCDEVHKHPSVDPEYKLITVISAIKTLTECICALHCADMIHRDIKPSNFGFVKRNNETLTQTLSMFDINTICSVFSTTLDSIGTDGFREPEAGIEPANNQTDIYAIGATLFSAIVVTDSTKKDGYLFRQNEYDSIRSLVDESKLIQASEMNSHPRLKAILTKVLQKCLCERTYRYESCEELIADLNDALFYSLPSNIAGKTIAGERWVLSDVEASLKGNKGKNSFVAIQHHLFIHPLYESCAVGEESINVLLLGFGSYGQKFLDACLQNGQIRSKKLSVTVVSSEASDKSIYLSERPELDRFFNIDGSLYNDNDSYGNVSFEIARLDKFSIQSNISALEEIICNQTDLKRLHYIFIALGDDDMNYTAASACVEALKVLEMHCTISYVCESAQASRDKVPSLYPLYINADIKQTENYLEIERMAFNVHLVWESNLNTDIRQIKSYYNRMYNHDACVSNLLSLKSKLFSVGINLTSDNAIEAARMFFELVADKKNSAIKVELMWMEHRRWVTEKLCQGYRRIINLEECINGATKDEKHKRHICIVKSQPNTILASRYSGNGFEKWDDENCDLSDLDDLDRLSVELHRLYAKRANSISATEILSLVGEIQSLVESSDEALIKVKEWLTCIKDILNREKGRVQLYEGLKLDLINSLIYLPKEQKQAVQNQIQAFEALFYPVKASMEYRNWKDVDKKLIDNIPFILTYSQDIILAIPYSANSNKSLFGNVAAPTVVNPKRVIFLYLINAKEDVVELLNSIPHVMEYFSKKHLRASVDYILAHPNSMNSIINDELQKRIRTLGEKRVRNISLLTYDTDDEVPGIVESSIRRLTEKRFFFVEKNSTALSGMLKGSGFYRRSSSYKFCSERQVFEETTGNACILGYIKKKSFITVTDMLSLQSSSSRSSNNPEFFMDYKTLWDKYHARTVDSIVWKSLCDVLGDHSSSNDIIATIKKPHRGFVTATTTLHYIIPASCSKGAGRILCALKENGFVEENSRIERRTSQSCEVILVDRFGNRNDYNALFAKVNALIAYNDLQLNYHSGSHELRVVFDNLEVSQLLIEGSRRSDMIKLLRFFESIYYITDLKEYADQSFSFTYASNRIKELLTTAGKMLEVYTFHKAKEVGAFDDVASSFEIEWEGTNVKNELDCIVTKGFRSLFIECKARPVIEQGFYDKIKQLSDKFGINATAVLVADTQERESEDFSAVNTVQRQRGSMMDVITIWKPNEINNIGHTLLKIINGTYICEEV